MVQAGFLLTEPTLDDSLGVGQSATAIPSIVRYERGRPIGGAAALAASQSAAHLRPVARSLPRPVSAQTLLTRPPPRARLASDNMQYKKTSPRRRPESAWSRRSPSPPDSAERLMRATTSSGRERLKAIEAESEARKKVVIQPRRARSPCSSTGKPRRQTSLDDLLEVQHAASKMRSNGESGRRRASLRRRSVQQVLDKDRSDSTQEDRDAETQISVLSLLSNKPKHALRGDRANFDTPLNRLQAMLRREAQIKAKGGSQFSLLVR